MLSNPTPTSNLHMRQRQHRRQNSTPTAFAAVKIAPLPNVQRQHNPHHVSHRRGQSLDTRRQQLSPTTATTTIRQDFTTVSTSTTNNTGLANSPQHVLRESQQQRIARPGPGQPNFAAMTGDGENYLLSPQGTPHSQRFDGLPLQGQDVCLAIPFDAYMGPMSVALKKDQANFMAQDFELYGSDSALSTPTFITFPDSSPGASQQGWISEGDTASTRRTSRRISNGIIDRVAKFESMGIEAVQRPVTPPNQNATSYFPPTPMETPHERMAKHEQGRPTRFSDGYDESMEETIKPGRNIRPKQRSSGVFQDMRREAEGPVDGIIPAHPRSNTMPVGQAFVNNGMAQDFMNMNHVNAEFSKIENGFDAVNMRRGSLNVSPDMSQHSSPMTPQTATFGAFDNRPDFRPPDFDSQGTVRNHCTGSPTQQSPASRRGSPHRRTESLASIASAASIASINIEETKTETGVTMDDITAFIEGPDPVDGKWVCLYDSCMKKFGRKENIKSHVQTHLNDRQYQCPTCKKCFVRQHDLKRHAKIHTGIKPYPCECGNSFARHDALTRHRQRGMCIGAFDGIVRKVVKRGRPRKNRPDMDSRLDKAARTRTKNRAAAETSSMSSQSGYSDSSAANSPSNEFEGMLDDSPFDDVMDIAMGDSASVHSVPATATMNPSNLAVSSAPMTAIGTVDIGDMAEVLAVVSPEHAVSPSAVSHYSHASHVSLVGDPTVTDGLPPAPASPAKSVASHYTHQPGTPPELSASSSPPPARFFDLDPNSSGCADGDSSLGMITTAAHGLALTATASGNMSGMSLEDDDMLLQAYTNEDGLVQLNQENMLGGSTKFDDEFEAAMGMNMNMFGEDLYYSNP